MFWKPLILNSLPLLYGKAIETLAILIAGVLIAFSVHLRAELSVINQSITLIETELSTKMLKVTWTTASGKIVVVETKRDRSSDGTWEHRDLFKARHAEEVAIAEEIHGLPVAI